MNSRKNKKLYYLWLTEEDEKKLEIKLHKKVLDRIDLSEIGEILIEAKMRRDFNKS